MGINITQFAPPGTVSKLVWDDDMKPGAGKIFKGDLTGDVTGDLTGNAYGFLERDCTLGTSGAIVAGNLSCATVASSKFGSSIPVSIRIDPVITKLASAVSDDNIFRIRPNISSSPISGTLPVSLACKVGGSYNSGFLNMAAGTLVTYDSTNNVLETFVINAVSNLQYYISSLQVIQTVNVSLANLNHAIFTTTAVYDTNKSGKLYLVMDDAVIYGDIIPAVLE